MVARPDRDVGPALANSNGLEKDLCYLAAGGSLRDSQPIGNLADGEALREQPQDLHLAGRQIVTRVL